MKRVIAVSGVHGSGKSSFLADLRRFNSFEVFERTPYYNLDDVFARMVVRLAAHIADARAQRRAVEVGGVGILLADRCALDALAYVDAFRKLDLATAAEHTAFQAAVEALFTSDLLPEGVLFLRPDISWVEQRIAERTSAKGAKWNEDVQDFLSVAYECFDSLFFELEQGSGSPAVLRISATERRDRCDQVLEWLGNMGWIQ